MATTILIVVSLTSIVWLTQALRYIELIVTRGLPVSTYLYMTSLLLPWLFSLVLPLGLVCATLFVFNKLSSDSELVVFKASGLSNWRLLKPALIAGMFFTLVGMAISAYILPKTYSEFKAMQSLVKNNFASVLFRERRFNMPIEGLTFYIDERGANGELLGITVQDNRKLDKPRTYVAEKGNFVVSNDSAQLLLTNASVQEVERDAKEIYTIYKECNRINIDLLRKTLAIMQADCDLGKKSCNASELSNLQKDVDIYPQKCKKNIGLKRGAVSILYFDQYPFDLNFFNKKVNKKKIATEEKTILELLNPPTDLGEKHIRKWKASAHQRIIWPLLCLVMVIICSAIYLSGAFNRRGSMKRIITAGVISVLPIVTTLVGQSMYASGKLIGLGIMYGVPLLLIISGLYLIFRNPTARKGPKKVSK